MGLLLILVFSLYLIGCDKIKDGILTGKKALAPVTEKLFIKWRKCKDLWIVKDWIRITLKVYPKSGFN